MSSEALPIPPSRFAKALADLPVSSLHAKVSELRNSIAHLEASNKELEEWAAGGDKDCYEAWMENKEVLKRFEERIELVKREIVEVRGLPFEAENERPVARTTDGVSDAGVDGQPAPAQTNGSSQQNSAAANGTSNGQQSPAGEDEGVFL